MYILLSIYILKNNNIWFLAYLGLEISVNDVLILSSHSPKDCWLHPPRLRTFADHCPKKPERHGVHSDGWHSPALGFTSSQEQMPWELHRYQSILWKQRRGRSLPTGEELGVFREEGALEVMKHSKSFVLYTLRKPFFVHVLLWPQQHYRMGGWGKAVEWGRVSTPAMYGCWCVFLWASFVPVCFIYTFLPPSENSDTHFRGTSGHSARSVWGGRAPGQRWSIFQRLMSNAASLSSYF